MKDTPLTRQAIRTQCLLSVNGDFPLLESGIIVAACCRSGWAIDNFIRSWNQNADFDRGAIRVTFHGGQEYGLFHPLKLRFCEFIPAALVSGNSCSKLPASCSFWKQTGPIRGDRK
ncbi:hypothetical protein AYI70_g3162 [Smittium culicis]|uniref:Uncharacterized protein n=1 Tax=Smittium culicis TaxID=133412 RepID=A0A1R1Y526_9FUNG|nr:hypothetical protein AYI70_g3162 [Smittium culicis]